MFRLYYLGISVCEDSWGFFFYLEIEWEIVKNDLIFAFHWKLEQRKLNISFVQVEIRFVAFWIRTDS